MSIHPSAIIDHRASLDSSASIGPFVIIEGPAVIGAGCRLEPFVVVKGRTELGPGCRLHSHAVVGDLPQDVSYKGDTSFCRIGAGTVLREGVTIHRGTAPASTTSVGANCLLMTNAHIGHNCTVGDGAVIMSGALLGGHVEVGDRAVVSKNSVVQQLVRIGELALVGTSARVAQDIPPFFLSDRNGKIVGDNRAGLARANFSLAERREIEAAYLTIYGRRLGRNDAVDYLERAAVTPAGRRLLEFFLLQPQRGSSRREIGGHRVA